jgi:formate--tetrahydrofolate ligase
LWDKAEAVARKIYRAAGISATSKARATLDRLQAQGHGHLPVCIAKTPYSFTTDPAIRGAVQGHVIDVREVRLSAGAEFVVLVCGDIMTMPGLPAIPAASSIDVDEDGRIVGLF